MLSGSVSYKDVEALMGRVWEGLVGGLGEWISEWFYDTVVTFMIDEMIYEYFMTLLVSREQSKLKLG